MGGYDRIIELVKVPKDDRRDLILSWCDGRVDDVGNIIIDGETDYYFSAHYDVVNEYNANDNSASVINLLELKKIKPEASIVLTNYEESPYFGKGSDYFAKTHQGVKYIFNLELTGIGRDVFVNHHDLESLKGFNLVSMPFSDSDIFIRNGIPSVTLVTTPREYWGDCHTPKDTLDRINLLDMKQFVEEVLYHLKV